MVRYRLDDNNIDENFKAIEELRSTGMFTEEDLQEMYDKQVEADREQRENIVPDKFISSMQADRTGVDTVNAIDAITDMVPTK